jgi:hypothetical protein
MLRLSLFRELVQCNVLYIVSIGMSDRCSRAKQWFKGLNKPDRRPDMLQQGQHLCKDENADTNNLHEIETWLNPIAFSSTNLNFICAFLGGKALIAVVGLRRLTLGAEFEI